MAAVEHSAVHPVGVQMLLGDRYPGCAARPWATMFNRVAVVVRAIAKFWNLELGTWNLELGTWNLEPALGLPGEASAGLVLTGLFAFETEYALTVDGFDHVVDFTGFVFAKTGDG